MTRSNVRVENRKGFEQMMRIFRRQVTECGILHELKRREFYEKPSAKRRRKIRQRERELAKAKNESKR